MGPACTGREDPGFELGLELERADRVVECYWSVVSLNGSLEIGHCSAMAQFSWSDAQLQNIGDPTESCPIGIRRNSDYERSPKHSE